MLGIYAVFYYDIFICLALPQLIGEVTNKI